MAAVDDSSTQGTGVESKPVEEQDLVGAGEVELDAEHEQPRSEQTSQLRGAGFIGQQRLRLQQRAASVFKNTAIGRLDRPTLKHDTREAFGRVLTPDRFRERIAETTRFSQVMAFLFVGFLIVVSLPLIVAVNEILEDVLLQDLSASQYGFIGFLVTLLSLGTLILAAWFWFIWVRTGGFGFFDL